MKNSFPLLSSLGDDHVTFEDVIGDDWTDPIAVLPLPRLSKTCVGDQQAAGGAAIPQIRNMATLGGNLCQRPRCWYFRSGDFHCIRKGGDTCFA